MGQWSGTLLTVANWSAGPRDLQVRADLPQGLNDLRPERDAPLHAVSLEREALLPVHVDPVVALRLRPVLQALEVLAHLALHPGKGAERLDVDRAEEVPHVRTVLVHVCPTAKRGRGERRAQQLHRQREAVALVAGELLALAAEREDSAAAAVLEIVEHLARGGRPVALRVDGPSPGHRLPEAVVHPQLSPRDDRRGGVGD